jgi:hypothetical protein
MNSNTTVNKTLLLSLGDKYYKVKYELHLVTSEIHNKHCCWCSGYRFYLVSKRLVVLTHFQYNNNRMKEIVPETLNSYTEVNKSILFLLGNDTYDLEVCTIHMATLRLATTHRRWCSGYSIVLIIQSMVV